MTQGNLTVHGRHHVTAICGPAQESLDLYVGILGMRLVKCSVNQDDPGPTTAAAGKVGGQDGSNQQQVR